MRKSFSIFLLTFFFLVLTFSSVSAKLTSTSTKVNCLDITGGSDSDYCIDASGNGSGGGNTTEEMQDAVGSGFTGNLSYNDAGNTFDISGTNILTWLDGFYVRISNLVNLVGNWSADKPSYTPLTTLNNGSYLNLDWLLKSQWNATNTSYLQILNWNSTNLSYATVSNLSNYLLLSNWNATNTSYLQIINWNATNLSYATSLNLSSYLLISNWNSTNLSYATVSNLSNYLLLSNWNATNTSYALFSQLNNGTYIINSVLNNGSYFNTAGSQTLVNNKTCSGTDKFSSYDNVTGNFVCSTDQTGAGSGTSFNVYNRTTTDLSTTSNTKYTQVFSLPMTANRNVTIDCELTTWANVATVGVQFTFNFTNSGIKRWVLNGEYYTGTTAKALISGNATNGQGSVVLSPTTSAGTTNPPLILTGFAETNGTGASFLVMFRSETATRTEIKSGSFCRSVETNGS